MSQVIAHDRFILVGNVPLYAVNSLTLDESFKLPEMGTGTTTQWLGRANRTISIDGVLLGPGRFQDKLALETVADLSSLLAATVAVPGLGGVPVVSALTVLPDMRVTSLRFTQTSQEHEAIGVSISLLHCPKGLAGELVARGTNMASALAGAPFSVPGVRVPGTLPLSGGLP